MIKYNDNTINKWYHDGELIKVYYHGAVCYYKLTPSGQTPCFAVVADISQYSDTEFIDVFNQADGKWYKLNNLNAYEEYGVYGSGRTITTYEGKLTIDGDYEYQYSGSSWVNVGEISGDTHDYSQDYLTLQALESGTIGFSAGTVDYSTDSGSTWNTLAQGNTISVSQGDEVLFKKSGSVPTENYGIGAFTSSCRFNVYGNIMSLQESDNFATATTIYAQFQFKRLFAESKVVSAENMVLPATTLQNFCYNELFNTATYLTTPPKIFPATVLTQDCYSFAFNSCTSLTKSPVLPALTAARASYGWMFQNCTSLSEVSCLATNVSAMYATYDWLKNVASSGTFYKNPNASWSRGTSGIPSNWSMQDYVEPSPSYEYPVYYGEIQDPPNNLSFSSMAEAESYECPWVGMHATIAGDNYIFSGDSQSGYEWVIAPIDYTKTYLTFEPISSAVNFRNSTNQFQYSLDFGSTWTTLTTANTVTVNVGQKLMVKGSFTAGSDDNNGNKFIASGGTWKAYGNVLSLVGSDNYTATTAISDSQLINLFRDCTTLVDVDNLKMPAYTAGGKAIRGMFRNCSGLTHVPSDLLSTFSAFTGDATAMGMFEACTSLLESPIIPNMSIGGYGLWGMFISCSSLSACTCLLTNSYIGGDKTDYMLSGVAASGTFYKNPNATWQYSDASIPSGWSIQDYSG